MRFVMMVVLMLGAMLPGLTRAAERLVVVELFTSQGCSSCPPADAYLERLARRPDVLALALHVDYWDYLGWADKYARPQNTARQRDYARMGSRRTVFTPEVVVQGVDSAIGSHENQIEALIAQHLRRAAVAEIEVRRAGRGLEIHIRLLKPPAPDADVLIVRYVPRGEVNVVRGENAGKTLSSTNIVREIVRVGSWNGAAEAVIQSGNIGDGPVAVLLQDPKHGTILAAARLP